jgi:hypothetical protein
VADRTRPRSSAHSSLGTAVFLCEVCSSAPPGLGRAHLHSRPEAGDGCSGTCTSLRRAMHYLPPHAARVPCETVASDLSGLSAPSQLAAVAYVMSCPSIIFCRDSPATHAIVYRPPWLGAMEADRRRRIAGGGSPKECRPGACTAEGYPPPAPCLPTVGTPRRRPSRLS